MLIFSLRKPIIVKPENITTRVVEDSRYLIRMTVIYISFPLRLKIIIIYSYSIYVDLLRIKIMTI